MGRTGGDDVDIGHEEVGCVRVLNRKVAKHIDRE